MKFIVKFLKDQYNKLWPFWEIFLYICVSVIVVSIYFITAYYFFMYIFIFLKFYIILPVVNLYEFIFSIIRSLWQSHLCEIFRSIWKFLLKLSLLDVFLLIKLYFVVFWFKQVALISILTVYYELRGWYNSDYFIKVLKTYFEVTLILLILLVISYLFGF